MWYLYTNYIIGAPNTELVDIIKLCNNLQWNDDQDTLAVSLTFDSILDLAEGRTHLVLKKDDKIVFQGVVINKNNKDKSSSYTAQDYAFYLNKNEDIRQFNGIDAKNAIYQLLTKHNIGGACTTLNTKITKLYKGQKLSDIIKDILEQCTNELGEDIVMEMRKDVLWIDKVSNLKLDCKYILSNDFSITRSMEDMVNNVIVSSNEESDSSILASARDENTISIYGQLTKVITVDKQNESQAQNTANNYLSNYNGTKREFTGTLLDVENCEDVRAKRKIYLDIKKYGVYGYYKVKSAQHSLSNNIHKINVTIDFSCAKFQDPAELSSSPSNSNTSSNSNTTSAQSSKQDEIIAYAKTFLGVSYVYGGKTPSGFDCSGFVAYVFNHFGYSLESYTYTMINQGTSVGINNIQPCDLVFFYNTGHVGIYLGGNQFIHAPHTGDVVKISPFSGYYSGNCNAVIRVL